VTVRRLRWISIAGTAALLVAVLVLSILARVELKPSNLASTSSNAPAPLAVGTELQRPRLIPHFELIDERGRPFSLDAWRGRYVVLAPSMTLCHEVCPLTTGALIQLTTQLRQAGLARQVAVVEATVDPWRDSPARLRAYRRLAGVSFQMLTGTQSEIRRLWKFFGVYYHRIPQGKPPDIDWLTHKPETFDVAHTDALFFIDPAGQEQIVDEGMPDVGGNLSPVLRSLLSAQGRQNLAHPELPWTSTEAFDDVYYMMGKSIPASATQAVTPPSAAAAQSALADSPAPLASLHAQANQLLGSEGALVARLGTLHGRYPAVVNAWASWCGPCQAEFPFFASASARYGRQVAFVGVDTNDDASEARTFLAHHPVSYPSYQSSSDQLSSLAVIEGMPTTIFIDRAGKVVHVQIGQYGTLAALQNDIEHYAFGVAG
jgi:cytochrome oxidase Cu insertion factor (SCO1/SenC/PrrC family)/thiol-disulfide isomerase/thioredoxin